MFNATEYLHDIFNYGISIGKVSHRTKLTINEIDQLYKEEEVMLTSLQQKQLIYLWGDCIHNNNLKGRNNV